jgi:uncharacterized protein
MKYVVLYETAPNALGKAMELYPAHQRHYEPYAERGELQGLGTFGDPQTEGSMAIFTTRDAAERFVNDDPFVTEGVVARFQVRDWDDVVGES